VLALSREHPFARRLVNSGRLSVPTTHRASPLSTPDRDSFSGSLVPGAPAADAPVKVDERAGWLLDCIGGCFDLLLFDGDDAPSGQLSALDDVRLKHISTRSPSRRGLHDVQGLATHRYDAQPGTAYLLRPDQHVAARWRVPSLEGVRAALTRAKGCRQ
jgi:3-(3-hydroxy-phenyl)propionate hydroxylase